MQECHVRMILSTLTAHHIDDFLRSVHHDGMTKTSKPRPLTDRQLLLLGAMNDRNLFYSGNVWSTRNADFVGKIRRITDGKHVPEAELNLPFPLTTADFSSLHVSTTTRPAPLLKGLDVKETTARLREAGWMGKFAFNDQVYVVTEACREILTDSSERLNTLRLHAEQARENPRLLVGMRFESYSTAALTNGIRRVPGAGNLYAVLGETKSSFRVRPWDSDRQHYDVALSSNMRDNFVISKENVLEIDVTPERYAVLLEATREYQASVAAVEQQTRTEMEEILAPIKRRAAQRIEQLKAMLEDGMRPVDLQAEADVAPKGPGR